MRGTLPSILLPTRNPKSAVRNRTAVTDGESAETHPLLLAAALGREEPRAVVEHRPAHLPPVPRERPLHAGRGDELLRAADALPRPARHARPRQPLPAGAGGAAARR